ncbi:alpha-L-fucosidase [Prevotella sp.]|uniref:alpha-L-fucosidase n=1 Tax=Prevotella sp. TaxID=59823 RepID=UPI002F95878E
MKKNILLLSLCMMAATTARAQSVAPQAIAPLPEPRQVAWQQLETYAFVHFGPNTFGDREWGYGDAELQSFNPTRLDCEQWALTAKAAGLKGIILTAKHHDGFCLWPTKYTDYSVRNTPYKNGKGDIVGELAEACRKHGLKLGLYLSPWDRHQAFYGTDLYREYFYAQLTELLTQYGPLFEVWFDGANGGDGWYGGAKEERTIDRRTYYDFPRAWAMVDKLQPNAVIFSDGGPGCRWVGNERGYAFATNWSLLRSKEVYPGYSKYWELQQGHADGDKWVPAECNTSIRPGWFYHESEDNKVKSVDHLVDLYYRSVGHNGTFLINLPINKEGLVHPVDSTHLVMFHRQVVSELANNLALKAKVTVSTQRGKQFAAKNMTDNNFESYWATPDGVTTGEIVLTFGKAQKLNRLKLQEYIPLGQRVRKFSVEYLSANGWLPVEAGEETTTIGYKRLLRFKTIQTRRLRVRITDSRGPLCINEIGAYYAPQAKEAYINKVEEVKSLDFTEVERTASSITIDLGKDQPVKAFYYLPKQGEGATGLVSNYEIEVGNTLDGMTSVASGEFSNIRNNPVMQSVYFTPIAARYIRLKATRMVNVGEAVNFEKIAIQ